MSDGPGSSGVGAIVGIFTALVGVATIAILVSQKSQTSQVLQALATGGSNLIGAAVSPVTGSNAGSSSGSNNSSFGSGFGVQAP
jgi:hypothetical protein